MTTQQRGLLTKALRSLAAARRLAVDRDLDFAMSRAYYAMFYTAQAFLFGRGLRFSLLSSQHLARSLRRMTKRFGNSTTGSSKPRTLVT